MLKGAVLLDFTYICNDSHDPRYNLALEETLFQEAVAKRCGFLMLWVNDPVVVVGRYQNTAEEVNKDFTEQNHVHVVRRMTGGGAVYHDRGNLNYTVIMPSDDAAVLDIQAFGIPLLDCLQSLGVTAERTGRNDVTVQSQKISGVAQYSSNGIVLHHGTILYDSSLQDVAKALNVSPEKYRSKGFKSVRSRVTNLRGHLAQDMSLTQFQKYFEKVLVDFYHAVSVRPPSEAEHSRALELAREKYGSWDWVWGQSPAFTAVQSRRFAGGTVTVGLVVEKGLIRECRIFGDFFSLKGVDQLQSYMEGRQYPFADSIDDLLITESFTGVPPEEFRQFLREL